MGVRPENLGISCHKTQNAVYPTHGEEGLEAPTLRLVGPITLPGADLIMGGIPRILGRATENTLGIYVGRIFISAPGIYIEGVLYVPQQPCVRFV